MFAGGCDSINAIPAARFTSVRRPTFRVTMFPRPICTYVALRLMPDRAHQFGIVTNAGVGVSNVCILAVVRADNCGCHNISRDARKICWCFRVYASCTREFVTSSKITGDFLSVGHGVGRARNISRPRANISLTSAPGVGAEVRK